MSKQSVSTIAAIIGLGNPGAKFVNHRHNIGFRVVEKLAERFFGSWQSKDNMEVAEIQVDGKRIILIKPQTFMNDSGRVIPFLLKKGIKPEEILVVHDELEQEFGKLKIMMNGGHRGHNGLKSIMGVIGKEFSRMRFGIGRPQERDPDTVGRYVLGNFTEPDVEEKIEEAADMIENLFQTPADS